MPGFTNADYAGKLSRMWCSNGNSLAELRYQHWYTHRVQPYRSVVVWKERALPRCMHVPAEQSVLGIIHCNTRNSISIPFTYKQITCCRQVTNMSVHSSVGICYVNLWSASFCAVCCVDWWGSSYSRWYKQPAQLAYVGNGDSSSNSPFLLPVQI